MSEKDWSEVRLFVTQNNFSSEPKVLNADMAPSGIPALKSYQGVGFEFSTPLTSFIKVGIRGGGRWKQAFPPGYAAGPTVPFLAVQQGYGGLLARVVFLQTSILRLDAFGEAGLTRTHLDTKTTSGTGTYSAEYQPYSRAGASVGLGFGKFFLFAEGGIEQNKVNNFARTGVTDSAISSVDFSGPYAAFGIIFNGVPSFIKMK